MGQISHCEEGLNPHCGEGLETLPTVGRVYCVEGLHVNHQQKRSDCLTLMGLQKGHRRELLVAVLYVWAEQASKHYLYIDWPGLTNSLVYITWNSLVIWMDTLARIF